MTDLISYQSGKPDFVKAAAQQVLSKQAFDEAFQEITQWQGYGATPLYSLPSLAKDLELGTLCYKDEGPRFGLASFKALGGAYAALHVLKREIERRMGQSVTFEEIRTGQWAQEVAGVTLTSATDGNHGRSLAWGCQMIGAPCRIYIHAQVSEGRAQAMQALGAEVIRIEGDYDASVDQCRREAQRYGWFVVSDTSWPGYNQPPRDVMAGYGVMAREVFDSLTEAPTHIFLQAGVGGLAAAMAASLRQLWGKTSPRIVVVEPDFAPCLFESARAGAMTVFDIKQETIMAGLSCGAPSPLAWEILQNEVSDFLSISDDLIGPAMVQLARPSGDDPKIEAGESGVAGLAALMAVCQLSDMRQKLGLDHKSRVLLIGSEGVTDPVIYNQIMQDVSN